MDRIVVVLCGPPGAGKTTAALSSGLQVFDRDDACWTSESQFRSALVDIGRSPSARAVVIRSAASSQARAKVRSMVSASHVFLVVAGAPECRRRVMDRGRTDRLGAAAGVTRWFTSFDDADGVLSFPGWPAVLSSQGSGVTSREW